MYPPFNALLQFPISNLSVTSIFPTIGDVINLRLRIAKVSASELV